MTQQPDRRAILALFGGAGVSWLFRGVMSAQQRTPAASALDHLILGAADLDRGIDWFEKLTGTRLSIGGSHPGRGTRNALAAFGGRQYIEILAPDPAQPANPRPELRALPSPRLIGWAAASSDIAALNGRIRSQGVETAGPRDGSRARPDGRTIRWTTLGITSKFGGGGVDPVPFFIQWAADAVHPSADSPKCGELASLSFEHPDAAALTTLLSRIGIDAAIRSASTPAIVAELSTPKGPVVLR